MSGRKRLLPSQAGPLWGHPLYLRACRGGRGSGGGFSEHLLYPKPFLGSMLDKSSENVGCFPLERASKGFLEKVAFVLGFGSRQHSADEEGGVRGWRLVQVERVA